MRALAETVWRLVRRDKSQTAVHLISRVLSELDLQRQDPAKQDREQRAYLLNLRGVIYAQRGLRQPEVPQYRTRQSRAAAQGSGAQEPSRLPAHAAEGLL